MAAMIDHERPEIWAPGSGTGAGCRICSPATIYHFRPLCRAAGFTLKAPFGDHHWRSYVERLALLRIAAK
jgi:hypothetical protein